MSSLKTVRILQLSDFHFGSDHQTSTQTGGSGMVNMAGRVAHSPVSYLLSGIKELLPLPDLIFFSGDYVTGRDPGQDLSGIKQTLSDIGSETSVYFNSVNLNYDLKNRILIVPGNHDVERGESDPLKIFKHEFRNYLTPYTPADSSDKVRKFAPLYVFEEINLVVYCLSTVEMAGIADTEIQDTIDYIEKYGKEDSKTAILKSLRARLYPDAPGITEEIYRRFIEKNDEFKKVFSDFKSYTKILLCHHPFIFSDLDDPDIRFFTSLINGGSFYKALNSYEYKIICHGHTHSSRILSIGDVRQKENRIINIGTPSIGSQRAVNGIATLDLRTKNSAVNLQISFRDYERHLRKFESKLTSEDILISMSDVFDDEVRSDHQKILVDTDLRKLVSENRIIMNGNIDRVQPTHYDCALGSAKRSDGTFIDLTENEDHLTITIQPNEMITVETIEEFHIPNNMVFHVSPLARWMRKGLIANISFFGDAGFKGKFSFPIVNITKNDVEIEINKSIISVEITVLKESVEKGWFERKQRN